MKLKTFANMKNHKLEFSDQMVVLKLDRSGRDNNDLQQTIAMLMEKNIDVVSLDMPTHNLASADDKLLLQVYSAFAKFEKPRITERIKEGLERAKKESKKLLSRPEATGTCKCVRGSNFWLSHAKTAAALKLEIATVKRH
ncbi:recombinase family protein [Pantoea dispersa]|uniref:recombinase family protein n=1 Tax=Pantoea dispersa TaxID=59814 RepID=UPI0020135E39|nr:recombinase family protein [Pantoea dispersa]